MAGFWFIVVFVIALILWSLLRTPDKSYLNDPYYPDDGGRGNCIVMPSGDCI